MNKDTAIRNLRYEKEKHKNDRVDTFGTDISMMCTDILGLLENCIEIPDGATNGDMMKAVFPDLREKWRMMMNRSIFNIISNFAKRHDVDITFEFDCTGDLKITMTRDEYSIDKEIACHELTWLEDCDNVILAQLYSMLNHIS